MSIRPPVRTSVSSRDAGQMEDVLRSVYGSVRMASAPGSVVFTHTAAVDDALMWGSMRIGAEMSVATDGLEPLLLCRMRRGVYDARIGGEDVPVHPGGSILFVPDVEISSHLADVEVDAAQLTRSALEGARVRLLPHGRLALEGDHRLLDPEAADIWWRAAEIYSALMRRDELYQHDILRDTARDTLFAATFTAIGLADQRADRSASEAVVRRAARHIDEHLSTPLTVPGIAAAVGVSARSLQAAFRRVRDITPHAYLTRARLDAAHRQLIDSDPGTTTVEAIARAWGFAHVGRFAGLYRERYGVSPSVDLRS